MVHKEGIRSLKIKRVTEYLLNVLLPLPYGGKLPGIRTIRKETGVGQSAVTHALRQLEKDGLIRIDPERGTFRIKPVENSNQGIQIKLFNKLPAYEWSVQFSQVP